jgi:hypothetical protein
MPPAAAAEARRNWAGVAAVAPPVSCGHRLGGHLVRSSDDEAHFGCVHGDVGDYVQRTGPVDLDEELDPATTVVVGMHILGKHGGSTADASNALEYSAYYLVKSALADGDVHDGLAIDDADPVEVHPTGRPVGPEPLALGTAVAATQAAAIAA